MYTYQVGDVVMIDAHKEQDYVVVRVLEVLDGGKYLGEPLLKWKPVKEPFIFTYDHVFDSRKWTGEGK